MSKKIQDQFIDNIPAALKNNELIIGYNEAVGEIFEEIRQDINLKAYETDYAKSKTSSLVDVTKNIGLELSPFIREDVIRRIIRDMPRVYTRMGTRDSLTWALKTLGYRSFEIDETWAPNPDLIREGYYRGLMSTNEPERYDLKENSYADFVLGEEYVTNQGTFFKGYLYNDFEKTNEISGIPIYGESYSTYTGLSFKDMVSKTPYVLVRIYNPPLYDEVITDKDPVTGEVVELTVQEKQRIITESIRYLVRDLQRTATTSIILVTDLLVFNDVMGRMLDGYQDSFTSLPLSSVNSEEFINKLMDQHTNDGRIYVGSNNIEKIGSNRLIGKTYPQEAIGEYTDQGVIGVTPANIDILENIRAQNLETKVINPPDGYKHVHYLDFNATVSFTAPVGINDIVVESARNFNYTTIQDYTLWGFVDSGQTFSQVIPDSHAVIITFPTGFTGTLTITSTY